MTRPRRLFPSLTATLAAAALALAGVTASAAPARADDQLIRFLAGATALVILFTALDSSSKSKSKPCRNCYTPQPLPGVCAVEISAQGHGRQVYYGKDCLAQRGVNTARLPRQCEATVRSHRQTRQVYSASCLRSYGYPVVQHARRH